MQPPPPSGMHPTAVPQFYVTPRQRFSAVAVLLALVLGCGVFLVIVRVLNHVRHAPAGAGAGWFARTLTGADADDDEDDPSRVDTIYLGDPSEAPVATRPGGRPSTVHPFVVVQLPHAGDTFGKIPDTPAGRLLYAWLAAFNTADFPALSRALPSRGGALAEAAEQQLRLQTGGFTLISAREVAPGVLVFRLHDQTAAENEVLGTLQLQPRATPPAIASFSLRATPPPPAAAH